QVSVVQFRPWAPLSLVIDIAKYFRAFPTLRKAGIAPSRRSSPLIGAERTSLQRVRNDANVKVFGCRPLREGWRAHGRPASENLQGRKPREGRRGRFVARYGDLSAANAARD